MTEKEKNILDIIHEYLFSAECSNEFIVANLQLLGDYGLKSIKECANQRGIKTQSLYNNKGKFKFQGYTFIVDNV